jgi:hypothetical protein
MVALEGPTARRCGWFLTRPSFWNDFRTVPLPIRLIRRAIPGAEGRVFDRRSTPMNVGNKPQPSALDRTPGHPSLEESASDAEADGKVQRAG